MRTICDKCGGLLTYIGLSDHEPDMSAVICESCSPSTEKYLRTAKESGSFLTIAKMMESPLTLEQKREQVAKGCPELVRYTKPKNKI